MITGTLKNQIDRIWEMFWSGDCESLVGHRTDYLLLFIWGLMRWRQEREKSVVLILSLSQYS